jgi:FlaA1/EpsC-like NDP-sugar epimerase
MENVQDPEPASGWWAKAARTLVRSRADALLALLDALLLATAYLGVLVLRYEGNVPQDAWDRAVLWLPSAVGVGLAALWCFGLYGQVWRHASAEEARRLLDATGTALLVLSGVALVRGQSVPWSVLLLGTGLGGFLLGAVRFRSRLFSFRRRSEDHSDGLKVIVIGARDAGAALIAEMRKSPAAGLVPVAVLDPDPHLHGRWISGLRVAGGYDQLPNIARVTGAHQAVVAMTSTTSQTVREIAAHAEGAGIALKIVDGIAGRMRGGAPGGIRQIRNLRIDDLIGRAQVETDLDAVRRMLAGRRVLVTGAGGSIGSEIVRQVAAAGPATLVALDHDESHLHDMAATLEGKAVQLLADVRDRAAVERAFQRHKPEIVFHAAAHKHVPLLEDHPSEAILTNVAGTQHLLDAAAAVGVERFVFISTDKAVAPKSVMGASKRLGEHLVLSQQPPGATHAAVRFGNVLGSRGSVVPTFVRQIEDGGPVTVTDERMTRYFMSIPEAVQLVLQAAALAEGKDLFVLDMGEPVRILDLAERMIRLSGMRPGIDIQVQVTGVRPGEKLTEELLNEDEPALPTVHSSVSRISPSLPEQDVLAGAVARLRTLAQEQRDDDVRTALFAAAAPVGSAGSDPRAQADVDLTSDDAPSTQTD